MHKVSALLANWQLPLSTHSCNYFQVIRPILNRYFTVIKKNGVMTFSDFMITALKERRRYVNKEELQALNLSYILLEKIMKKKAFWRKQCTRKC